MTFAVIMGAAIAVFSQLSLTDAMQRGASNSVDVQIAIAAIHQREAQLRIARISAVPHLTGDYSLSPQAGPLDNATVEQHYIAVGAGISLSDLIAAPSTIDAAAGDLVAAQRRAAGADLTARENAVKLYFAALQAIAIERIRVDSLHGAQRDRNAAGLRSRNGESPAIDVMRADVTLSRARADLARAQADRADAVAALASATAIEPAALVALTPFNYSARNAPDEHRAVERALAMRPELSGLLASLRARNAELAGARRRVLPTATIQGGYQTGVDTGIPVRGPQAAAHVEMPFASDTRARVAVAQANVDTTYAQLLDERRTIALEVAAAIRDAQALRVAAQAAGQAKNEAATALAAVEIGYREGASSSLDVAIARRTYDEAQVEALVADYDSARALAIVDLVVP